MVVKKASVLAFVLCISVHVVLRRIFKQKHIVLQDFLLTRVPVNSSLQLRISSNAEDQGYGVPWRSHDMDLPNATTCVEADTLFLGRPFGGAL